MGQSRSKDIEDWRIKCEIDDSIPLFFTHKWMNLVAGKEWNVILSRNGDDEILGAWVYMEKHKYLISGFLSPILTPYLGIYYFLPKDIQKETSKSDFYKKVTRDLLHKLPKHTLLVLRCHHTLMDLQELHWAGFRSTVKYTYLLRNQDIDKCYLGFDSKLRNHIVKASESNTISISDDIAELYDFCKSTFERQKRQITYSFPYIKAIHEGLAKFGESKLYVASRNGKNVASLMIVNDKHTAYCLTSGYNEHAERGTMGLLMWHAIKVAFDEGLDFDFEGSDLKGVEHFYRGFGAILTPCYKISHTSNKIMDALFLLAGKI